MLSVKRYEHGKLLCYVNHENVGENTFEIRVAIVCSRIL